MFFLRILGIACCAFALFGVRDALAFQLTPSVADVVPGEDRVTQTVSVVNTSDRDRMYHAELQSIAFAPDGTIASLLSWDFGEVVRVVPEDMMLAPGAEGAFVVEFGSRNALFDHDVLALLVTESSEGATVHSGATTLFFLHDDAGSPAQFSVDAFMVARGSARDAFTVQATYQNLGNVSAFPVATVSIANVFGRELRWYPFHPHEGRLPVGTTRSFVQDIVFAPSFWHVGGPLAFTLTVADEGGGAHTRTVFVSSLPGWGTLGVIVVLLCAGLWGIAHFLRRRRVY